MDYTMQQLNSTAYILWTLIALLNTVGIQGMFHRGSFNHREYLFPVNITKIEAIRKALDAQGYNQHNPLIKLPNDTLKQIISYCQPTKCDSAKTLKKSIKNFIPLKFICKRFNKLLTYKTIGEFYKSYDLAIKNEVFKETLKYLFFWYKIPNRLPILIINYAGADAHIENNDHTSNLLHNAVHFDDAHVLTVLLNHQANPNAKTTDLVPVFFYAKTIKIAQMLIHHGVNIHAKEDKSKTNVLWKTVTYEYPSKLMAFYLQHKVNAKEVCCGNYLLHDLVLHGYRDNDHDFLTKAELLVEVIPDMINTLNINKDTPLDLAEEELKLVHIHPSYNQRLAKRTFKQLITLFKKYGGKTGQELGVIKESCREDS